MNGKEREKIPQQDKRQMKQVEKDGIDFIHRKIGKVNLDTLFAHFSRC